MTAGEGKKMVRDWLGDGTFDERLPEVAALRGVPQPEDYHAEGDAFTHTMLAVEAVDDASDPRVFWGTLLHDIGKSEKTFSSTAAGGRQGMPRQGPIWSSLSWSAWDLPGWPATWPGW